MRGKSKFKLTRYLPLRQGFCGPPEQEANDVHGGIALPARREDAPAIRILSDADLETVVKEGREQG